MLPQSSSTHPMSIDAGSTQQTPARGVNTDIAAFQPAIAAAAAAGASPAAGNRVGTPGLPGKPAVLPPKTIAVTPTPQPAVLPAKPEVLPAKPAVLPPKPTTPAQKPAVLPAKPTTPTQKPAVLPAKPIAPAIVLPAVLPVAKPPVPMLPTGTIVRTFGKVVAGKTTIRLGCIAPFTGVKAASGETMFQALRLAFQEQAAKELGPNANVVLTCVDAKCSDISAYNAMDYLVKTGAGEDGWEQVLWIACEANQQLMPLGTCPTTCHTLQQATRVTWWSSYAT